MKFLDKVNNLDHNTKKTRNQKFENRKVLAVTCDGTSPNHKLFKMHFPMTNEDEMNPD